MSKKMDVIINGGGLVGALAAIYMLQHTPSVTVVEKRKDLRNADAETGRSINLILTSRGLYALRQVNLEKKALELCVPVKGRLIHENKANATAILQPYGLSDKEVNYSVSRTALNAMLIDEACRRGARFFFEHELESMDFDTMCAVYKCQAGKLQMQADLFLGTDGVGSMTRTLMIDAINKGSQAKRGDSGKPAAEATMERLGISYKELTFHAKSNIQTNEEEYPMDAQGLHIWPRGPHFLMALADKKNTFTGTLYLPDGSAPLPIPEVQSQKKGAKAPTFEELGESAANYAQYFKDFYPDVPAIVPDYNLQLSSRPHSFLATLRTTHWALDNKCCLLGDAAHGVVPFFGQGMNLGFESVVLFDRFLARELKAPPPLTSLPASQSTILSTKAAVRIAIEKYVKHHKDSATAIADMAIENFAEMSFKVGLPEFLARKQIEHYLEECLPTMFRSRYYMVTKTLIPYALVQNAGFLLDQCIDSVIADAKKKLGKGQPMNDPKVVVDAVKQLLTKEELKAHVDAHVTLFFTKHGIEVGNPLAMYYPPRILSKQ